MLTRGAQENVWRWGSRCRSIGELGNQGFEWRAFKTEDNSEMSSFLSECLDWLKMCGFAEIWIIADSWRSCEFVIDFCGFAVFSGTCGGQCSLICPVSSLNSNRAGQEQGYLSVFQSCFIQCIW